MLGGLKKRVVGDAKVIQKEQAELTVGMGKPASSTLQGLCWDVRVYVKI